MNNRPQGFSVPGQQIASAARSPVSLRSVLLGLTGAALICGLTPYNDYALANTPLVGNNLPLGVVMMLFLFLLLVNGPLNRLAPRWAFTPAELAVALAMVLVACAMPSSGLMRYFLPSLVSPFWHAQGSREYLDLLTKVDLPAWLLPSFAGNNPQDWMNDPIVTGFLGRWIDESSIPYRAWLRPAVTWGIFFLGLFGALIFLAVIVRRQWNENERLAFPLAQIQLALIERPAPGRLFNDTFRSTAFWIAFAGVFFIHTWNGSTQYWPQFFPEIPLGYDFRDLMSEPPLAYAEPRLMQAKILFTLTGATYFLSTPVAFSLWFFFVLQNLYRFGLGMTTGDPTIHGIRDQHLGAVMAFALVVLWIGRHHWMLVIRQAFRGERDDEPRGRYLSYPVAFWGLAGCFVLMVGWMYIAGTGLFAAIISITLLLTLFLVIARIIAETGLVYAGLSVPIQKPFQMAVMAGWSQPITLKSFYMASMLQGHHYDFREPLPVYATHGLKLTDQTIYGGRDDDDADDRRTGRKIIGALTLALVIGYFISLGSHLWTNYTYAATKDIHATSPINSWGAERSTPGLMLEPSLQYDRQTYHSQHNPWLNTGFGFGFTALLGYLRLTFTWWPLHPIGYLIQATPSAPRIWFSIMIGWLCKALIVKYGGAKLYVVAKPFFLGLIVGEALAAGLWLVASAILGSMGVPYYPVRVLTG
jgi:hypothetical protein